MGAITRITIADVKKACILLMILINMNAFSGKSRLLSNQRLKIEDTTILSQILALSLQSYIGKPVNTFLHHLPSTDSTLKIVSADNPYIASRLIVTYQNWYWVQIVVDTFQYMNPIDTRRQWDISLFKKETIAWIFVNQGNNCVYGCNSEHFRN